MTWKTRKQLEMEAAGFEGTEEEWDEYEYERMLHEEEMRRLGYETEEEFDDWMRNGFYDWLVSGTDYEPYVNEDGLSDLGEELQAYIWNRIEPYFEDGWISDYDGILNDLIEEYENKNKIGDDNNE